MILLLSKAKMQARGALCGESAAVVIGEERFNISNDYSSVFMAGLLFYEVDISGLICKCL